MTFDKAIKVLKKDIALCRFNPLTGEEVATNADNEESAQAIELAIEAVKKQIPKKPKDRVIVTPVIAENGAYVDADFYAECYCPICGEYVGQDDAETHLNFCHVCGQAIDWSEYE